jgi:hypothetical protein
MPMFADKFIEVTVQGSERINADRLNSQFRFKVVPGMYGTDLLMVIRDKMYAIPVRYSR